MNARISELPSIEEMQSRLERDGEVFLEVKKGEDGMYRLEFMEPEKIRTLTGGLK